MIIISQAHKLIKSLVNPLAIHSSNPQANRLSSPETNQTISPHDNHQSGPQGKRIVSQLLPVHRLGP